VPVGEVTTVPPPPPEFPPPDPPVPVAPPPFGFCADLVQLLKVTMAATNSKEQPLKMLSIFLINFCFDFC
jgi:hypothetical protein